MQIDVSSQASLLFTDCPVDSNVTIFVGDEVDDRSIINQGELCEDVFSRCSTLAKPALEIYIDCPEKFVLEEALGLILVRDCNSYLSGGRYSEGKIQMRRYKIPTDDPSIFLLFDVRIDRENYLATVIHHCLDKDFYFE